MNKKALILTIVVTVIAGMALFAVQRTLAMNASRQVETAAPVIEEAQTQAETSQEAAVPAADEALQVFENSASDGEQALANLPLEELSEAEKDALLFMREEEKLAHDVYVTLSGLWAASLPEPDVFARISQSELAHMESVKSLLDRYGIADPASSEVGVFTNPDLQEMYDQLVKLGSQSLADALKVGAAIEEIDILDLEERLALVDNVDIEQVFSNLAKASGNHLRSFAATLNAQTGEIYQPQYMSQETYESIVSGAAGQGGYGSGGGRGQGQGQGSGSGYGMRRGGGNGGG